MKTNQPRPAQGRHLPALSAAALLTMLAACGGGIADDSNGSAERLTCATTCKPSSTLSADQIRPSFVVVSDGARVQAQAGFSSGSDLRFNVEIEGSDSLRLNTTQGDLAFHIPATSFATIVIDAFQTLITGAKPYLSEVPPAASSGPLQFRLIRGTTTYASSVELPAAYQVVGPASGSTVAINSTGLPVRLSSRAAAATSHSGTFSCTDVNGNTASGTQSLTVVPGSVVSDATGVSYTLDIGQAVNGLTFTTTNPRGAVARCDVTLKFIAQAQGQADPRFGTTQVFAQQIRSASLAMR